MYVMTDWLWFARIDLVKDTKTGRNIPNDHKMYQIAIQYNKWLQYIPNFRKIFQHFPFQGPPKHTQIGIFGLKMYTLATLAWLFFKLSVDSTFAYQA
jgi:hypothetical protein